MTKIDQKIFKKVEKMTNENWHTVARLTLARDVLGDPSLTKSYEAICDMQKKGGCLTAELSALRDIADVLLYMRLDAKGLGEYQQAL